VNDPTTPIGSDPTTLFSSELYTLENTCHNSPCSSARSDGSRDFANSPRRIPTVQCLLDNSCKMNKVFLHGTCPPTKQLRYASFQHFKALTLLSFYHNSSLQKDSCTHSLRKPFKYFQVFEFLDSAHSLCNNSPSTTPSGCKL
jgi:hypothetical protein